MKTVVLFGFVLGALSAAGRVIVAKPGETVTLDCGVSHYSRSLEWKRENNLISSVDKSMRFHRKASGSGDIVKRSTIIRETNLKISGVKEEDAGKFTLVVDGSSHDVRLVVVSVSASPSADLQLGSNATLQCRVKGLNSNPAVQWVRPGESQGQTGPDVQLNPVARSDGGTWSCTFSHADGTHTERLEIKVHGPPTTPAPAGDPSQKSKDGQATICPKCDPSKSPPKVGQLLGLSWWMWVIVGVGCLVVVLLLVVVICLYKRIKRKKRRLQKMKNSRLPLTTKPYCQCDHPTAAAKPQQGRRREKPSAPPLQPLLIE